jgi:hypothetical protein
MPDAKIVFIDPKAALGALTPTPTPVKVATLGPNPPHADEPIEVEPIKAKLAMGLGPGAPPLLGEMHYTQILDQIWPEFDDPEERTAARLDALLDEVADEAQRVHLLAQDSWPKMPWYKVPELERKRWDNEFLAYLRRLNSYRGLLRSLEPDSTDTGPVYVGLVQRRQGAGPVPDCIMHLYFADQLGILAEHAEDMGEGFVGRSMDAIARVDKALDDAAAAVDEATAEAKAGFAGAWDGITRTAKIFGGVLLGSIVVITGAVVYSKVANRPQEPTA